MANSIGQIRYAGSGYITDVPVQSKYQSVTIGAENVATDFQDVVITLDGDQAFQVNRDYYLKIAIPQSLNYNMSFHVKLIKNTSDNITQVYQYLKNVNVPKGGSEQDKNVANVALYKKSGKDPRNVAAMIPNAYKPNITTVKDEIYYNPVADNEGYKFYLGTGTYNGYNRTTDVNMVTVAMSWITGITDSYGTFEMVFRPVDEGFNGILIEMEREPIDYNIQNTMPDGTVQFGRRIDLDKMQVTLYGLNNLVNNIFNEAGHILDRIGVWSHPGLMMAINGEEIKVGPSGFYECDVVPITSLAIVAPDNDFTNNFTVDYTYNPDNKVETVKEE